MKRNSTLHRTGLAAVALTTIVGLSACGSSDSGSSSDSSPSKPKSSMSKPSAAMDQPFGAACSQVPKTGEGSAKGMADDPVATAASNNPLLTTLVTAVGKAGLVDTLNSAPELTVFAPINPAFAKLPPKDLNALLANKPELTKVLTHHVVEGKLGPDEVAGTHKTLAGDEVTIEGSGEKLTSGEASIVCGNVQTANATVYLVDGVLQPSA